MMSKSAFFEFFPGLILFLSDYVQSHELNTIPWGNAYTFISIDITQNLSHVIDAILNEAR